MIITHESDLDGLVSGVLLQRLARKLFNSDVRLEAYAYQNWRQRELREKCGWIADITFEPRMDRPNWVIIDHHANDIPPKNALFIHDLNKSASLICYELCKQQGLGSPELDRLVHLSNVADLFLEDDPDFILATDYANLVKIYQFWNLHTLIGGQIEQLSIIRCFASWKSNATSRTRLALPGAGKTSAKSPRRWALWILSSATTT